MTQVQSFSLHLATVATTESLETWLESAAPRGRVIYASGLDLPREEAGVKLVRRWVQEGLVRPFTERDTHDRRRTNWIAEKVGTGVPGEAERPACGASGGGVAGRQDGRGGSEVDPRTRADAALLMDLLRERALRGRECPSNSEIARELGLGGSHRGRARAQYLMGKIASWGWVGVEHHGRNRARVVTVLRDGRAQGQSTRGQVRPDLPVREIRERGHG